MLDSVLQMIRKIHPLSDAAAEALLSKLEVHTAPKKAVLLQAGQRADYLYIVIEGLVRMYYVKDGVEVSCRFAEENDISAAIISFYGRKPGYEVIETLEPTTYARIHFDSLTALYESHPELNFIGRALTEQYFVQSEERLYLLRQHTAEERYLYFLNNYSGLVNRIPLKYIASYLGLTLETISRIRNKISRPVSQVPTS